MDFENTTALSDEAIALISPEGEPEMDIDPSEVELEDIEYGDDDYDSEPDSDYVDDDDDYQDDDEYEEDDDDTEDDEDFEDDYYDDDDDYVEALEIDGIGEVSIDDIIEWRQGNLRQADYTRKTQDLARQREEMQDAMTVYNYLKTNPNLLTSLADGYQVNDPQLANMVSEDKEMLRDLYYTQKANEVERQVKELESKYGSIDEVALYNKAKELNTDDLEFVYKSMAFDNNSNYVDEESLREQLRQEVLAEIESNKRAVKTVVNSRQSTTQRAVKSVSSDEARVAEGLGMSPSEYAKWRG